MTFPANDLERVLLATSRNETGVASFLDALLAAELVVPVTPAPDGGASLTIRSIDNRAYVDVFTSDEQAVGAGTDGPRTAVRGAELLKTVPEHVGFAVNPGGDLGLPVYADTLRQAANGSTRLTAGSRIRLGHPAEEPSAFLDALSTAFRRLPEVRSARRAWAAIDDQEPGLVIGVDVDPDSPDTRSAVIGTISATTRDAETPFRVDAVFTNDRDEFASWMQAETVPFYATS